MTRVRVLSFHAAYRCRHAGDCCTSGWPIPVEADRLAAARATHARGTLRTSPAATEPFIEVGGAPPETPALVAVHQGRCVFHRADPSGSCAWHAAMGHAALPLACRQFPRVSVITPVGTAVTLSHYCPTARACLDAPGGATVLTDPVGFPEDGEYVGLDVRDALPPLLRHDLLMDWDTWELVERRAVATLTEGGDPRGGLAALRGAVERLRDWRPGHGTLEAAVSDAFTRPAADRPGRVPAKRLVSAALDAVPEAWRVPSRGPSPSPPAPGAHARFLAAHAFASWMAQLGHDLRTWLLGVETAHALIESGHSLRDTDLLLRHLVDPATWASTLDRLGADRGPTRKRPTTGS